MIYGHPTKKNHAIGEARLLSKINEYGDRNLEYWIVEFLDEPGRHYNQFILAKDEEEVPNTHQ